MDLIWFYSPDTVYTPASGAIDLFTDYADPNDPGAYVITNNNAITRATDFYFDGAWFSGYSGVTFELWNDGNFLGAFGSLADAAGPDPYGPTFLASGYSGVQDDLEDVVLALLALGLTAAQARKSSPRKGA